MPRHDYYCARCGQVLVDIYRPASVGARADPPLHCGQRAVWIPATTAMDVGGVKTAGFKAFTTTDGRGHRVLVDSLRKLRQVEKDAEQAYRNGEGQPMVFRRWAQDRSNADAPTLSKSYAGGEQPTPEAAHRFGATLRKSSEAPEVALGPGVSASGASALKESGG